MQRTGKREKKCINRLIKAIAWVFDVAEVKVDTEADVYDF